MRYHFEGKDGGGPKIGQRIVQRVTVDRARPRERTETGIRWDGQAWVHFQEVVPNPRKEPAGMR